MGINSVNRWRNNNKNWKIKQAGRSYWRKGCKMLWLSPIANRDKQVPVDEACVGEIKWVCETEVVAKNCVVPEKWDFKSKMMGRELPMECAHEPGQYAILSNPKDSPFYEIWIIICYIFMKYLWKCSISNLIKLMNRFPLEFHVFVEGKFPETQVGVIVHIFKQWWITFTCFGNEITLFKPLPCTRIICKRFTITRIECHYYR